MEKGTLLAQMKFSSVHFQFSSWSPANKSVRETELRYICM